MRGFLVATQFLTILPVDPKAEVDGPMLARSSTYFPLVGLLIGAMEYGAYLLFNLAFPVHVTAALLLVVPLVVTGALHLDGLADTSDGIFSGRSRERMLEIMRDSRVGSFGVLVIAVFLILRWSLLSAGLRYSPLCLLLIPPAIARVMPIAAGLRYEYARAGQGLGRPYTDHMKMKNLVQALLICVAIAGILGYVTGQYEVAIGAPLGGWLLGWLYARYIVKKLGGVTGDTFGALIHVAELGAMLTAIAFLS